MFYVKGSYKHILTFKGKNLEQKFSKFTELRFYIILLVSFIYKLSSYPLKAFKHLEKDNEPIRKSNLHRFIFKGILGVLGFFVCFVNKDLILLQAPFFNLNYGFLQQFRNPTGHVEQADSSIANGDQNSKTF